MTPIPAWLPAFVQERMAEQAARDPQFAQDVAAAQGMLLYGTIGHAAYLRDDGSVWFHVAALSLDTEDDEEYEWQVATGTDRLRALQMGARRYPELLELLPQRPADAVECLRCTGTGRFLPNVYCHLCGGLGWVPASATE